MYHLFAWRYFKAKKSTNAINIIARISIVAIVIGTAALILVLSVFNGFEGLVKSLYSSFYPDIKVSPSAGKIMLVSPQQLERIKAISGIRNFSLVAEEKALVRNGDFQSIVYLKGVDENYPYVGGINDHMVKGEFNTGTAESASMILGAGVENAIGVQSDRNLIPLVVYLPKKTGADLSDPLQSVSADTIHTSGAFIIQQEFDNKYAITNVGFIKNMLGMKADEFGAIEIALKDPEEAEDIQKEVRNIFGQGYNVQTRYEQNQSLYAIMNTEKWVIYAVLSLILIVAAFTMIAALTMLVLEKEKDISVLHALGGSRPFIQKIFLSEGVLLAVIGGLVGMFIAFIIAMLQIEYKLIPLQGGSFLIDYFPVELKLSDFLLVGATVFVIALLASWLPSRKASSGEFSLRSE